MRKSETLTLIIAVLLPCTGFTAARPNFKVTNEMLYQKLIEIEKRQAVFEERFKQIDRRFEELREDINKRFEQVDKRFEDINKRFEDINKRFEEVNARFDQIVNFLWMLTGIFTAIMVGTIGFAYWDRRTMIREAKRQVYEDMDRELKPEKFKKLLNTLRELAEVNEEVRKILKREGLL